MMFNLKGIADLSKVDPTLSRRNFLTMLAAAGLQGCTLKDPQFKSNLKRFSRLIAGNSKDELVEASDSFIGSSVLERALQIEYDKGPESPLKIRSAPGLAHIPYELLAQKLQFKRFPPVMLYPGAGDDLAPILIGERLGLPVKLIYTEIDDSMVESARKQLNHLKNEYGVLALDEETRNREDLRETTFKIRTAQGKVDLIYRVRTPSEDFFKAEDIAEANILRENWTMNGKKSEAIYLISEMITSASDNRPKVAIWPDYSYFGKMYDSYRHLPIITGDDVLALETDPQKIGDYKDLHGQFLFVRGNVACSCDVHQHKFRDKGSESNLRKHNILYFPEQEDPDELFVQLMEAFTPPVVEIYRVVN